MEKAVPTIMCFGEKSSFLICSIKKQDGCACNVIKIQMSKTEKW
jgi:hypothetical protein